LLALALSLAAYSATCQDADEVIPQRGTGTVFLLGLDKFQLFDTDKFGGPLVWLTDDWLLTRNKENGAGVYDAVTDTLLAHLRWEHDPEKERYFDVRENREMRTYVSVEQAFLADNGSRLVTFHGNGMIRIWKTKDWMLEKAIESDLFRKGLFTHAEVTPDRKYIYLAIDWDDKKLRKGFLDWRTGKLVNLGAPPCVLGFSRSGNYAMALEDGLLQIYSYPDWRLVAQTRALQRYGVNNYGVGPVIWFGTSDEELVLGRHWGDPKEEPKVWFVCVYNWAKEKEIFYRSGEGSLSWPVFSSHGPTKYTPPVLIENRLAIFKAIKPKEDRCPGWMLIDFKEPFPGQEFALPKPWSLTSFQLSPKAKRVFIYIQRDSGKHNKVFLGEIPLEWHATAAELNRP